MSGKYRMRGYAIRKVRRATLLLPNVPYITTKDNPIGILSVYLRSTVIVGKTYTPPQKFDTIGPGIHVACGVLGAAIADMYITYDSSLPGVNNNDVIFIQTRRDSNPQFSD